jgi:hypothetical protein
LNDSSVSCPSSLQSLRACSLIRPPLFFKGISTFLPRSLLCYSLCLLTFVLSKWALCCLLRQFLNLYSVCYRGPLTKSRYFCPPPFPKNYLITPKAKLTLTLTKNYITRSTNVGVL